MLAMLSRSSMLRQPMPALDRRVLEDEADEADADTWHTSEHRTIKIHGKMVHT